MTGTVCLQGGGEFSAACRDMDGDLLRDVEGPVVVSALAGTPGRDYRTATQNGVTHLRGLGLREVVAAPDVRDEPDAAVEVLAAAAAIVLPGGSPSRLLAGLRDTPLADLVVGLLARGGVVMGASAGAMVLCPWTVLPDRSGPEGYAVAAGLAAVPGLSVVPHWTGASSRGDWLRALEASGTVVLGLPEESGVVVRDGIVTAVGTTGTTVVRTGELLEVGSSRPLADLTR